MWKIHAWKSDLKIYLLSAYFVNTACACCFMLRMLRQKKQDRAFRKNLFDGLWHGFKAARPLKLPSCATYINFKPSRSPPPPPLSPYDVSKVGKRTFWFQHKQLMYDDIWLHIWLEFLNQSQNYTYTLTFSLNKRSSKEKRKIICATMCWNWHIDSASRRALPKV